LATAWGTLGTAEREISGEREVAEYWSWGMGQGKGNLVVAEPMWQKQNKKEDLRTQAANPVRKSGDKR